MSSYDYKLPMGHIEPRVAYSEIINDQWLPINYKVFCTRYYLLSAVSE